VSGEKMNSKIPVAARTFTSPIPALSTWMNTGIIARISVALTTLPKVVTLSQLSAW
jgi:hypothetical protein